MKSNSSKVQNFVFGDFVAIHNPRKDHELRGEVIGKTKDGQVKVKTK